MRQHFSTARRTLWCLSCLVAMGGGGTAFGQKAPPPQPVVTPKTAGAPAAPGAKRPAIKEVSLWLNTPRVMVSDPAVLSLLRVPNLRRVLIPVLSEGGTPFVPDTAPFQQMALYENAENAIPAFIEQAHKRKIAVYGTLNLLQWVSPRRAMMDGGILRSRPDMLERVIGGSPGLITLGWYASPFHTDTRTALHRLIQEVKSRYSTLDGLVLQMELPTENYYGFSDAARQDSIRTQHIDPLDIELSATGEANEMLNSVASQRLASANQLMQELCQAIHTPEAGTKSLPISVLGDANIYRFPLRTRSRSLNDWLNWLAFPGVEEVILLQSDAAPPSANTPSGSGATREDGALAYASSLLHQDKALAKQHITLTARIPLRTGRRKNDIQAALKSIPAPTEQHAVSALLEITEMADLTDSRLMSLPPSP